MNAARPLFPVAANANTKTPAENVAALEPVCHVVEVKDCWALVHASPMGVARIAEMNLEVFPSKRGGEYYAVRVGVASKRLALAPAPVAAPAPVVAPAPAPAAPAGPARMNIGGTTYIVKETSTKRSQDVRRWEVRKLGDEIGKPYVVTFQSHSGSETACSCKGGIYHNKCKHMTALREAFGGNRVEQSSTQVA